MEQRSLDLWTHKDCSCGPSVHNSKRFKADNFYGQLIMQSDWWIDREGTPHQINKMDPSWCSNIVSFLHSKHGENLRWHWLRYKSTQHSARAPSVIGNISGRDFESRETYPIFSDNGGNLDRAFQEFLDREMEKPFDDFFEALPLIVALRIQGAVNC